MKEVLGKVLKKIKPSAGETKKVQKAVNSFLKKINAQFKDAKASLGGSGEKDTWLSGSHDVDIYVLFDQEKYKDKSEELGDILEEKIKKIFPKRKRLHGSRDYFQMIYQGYLFELVPILKINKAEEAVNITDISPLHAKWVRKAPVKVRDEIRLAKKFCKAQGCYGAESYIAGFSGYVLEILTIYYGSFEKLLRAAIKWENRDVMDIEKYFPKNGVFKELNRSKLNSPLVIIDPVDKMRNAAAALGLEKFFLFKEKAAKFLAEPSVGFFEKEKIDFKELEKKTRHNIVYLEAGSLAGKEDVVGNKLLHVYLFLKEKLKKFGVQEASWDWDKKGKAVFYFILEKKQIEPYFIRNGPPLKMVDQVKAFKKKNKETFEEKGRLMAKIPFKNFCLEDHVKEILKDKYLKEKVKKVGNVRFG